MRKHLTIIVLLSICSIGIILKIAGVIPVIFPFNLPMIQRVGIGICLLLIVIVCAYLENK